MQHLLETREKWNIVVLIPKPEKQLFIQGPFEEGTNNIGEFLAIVHGLALLKKKNSALIIYTDSRTAMSWVRKKNCNTKLERNDKNKTLFELVDRAVDWLKTIPTIRLS